MGGYLAYAEYKDSGIEWLGKIPTRWDAKRLKFLVAEPLKYGANEAAELTDPDLPRYIRITDVKDDGNLRDETFRSLPEDIAKDYLLEEGDILLARSGATVGKTFIYELSWGKAAYAGYLIRARMSDEVNSRFVYHFLQSNSYLEWVKSIFIQATIQNISAEKYANLWLPVPQIEEQRSIARFLDYKTAQIDALIAKKETLLKKLAEKRTALISQAVTKGCDRAVPMKDSSIEWLGEIPAHWELVRMRRRWKVIDCKHKTVEFIDEGFPIASIGEVRDHKFNLEQAKRASLDDYLDLIDGRKPEKNDLIYSRNATVGCVGFVDEDIDFCLGQDVCLIKTFTENNRFLWWQLQSISVTDQLQSIFIGATFKRINVADIKAYLVCCPPVDEQQNIAQYLDEKTKVIDQQKVQIEEAIAKLKEYRTALITNAVTGKINVRDVMLELEPVEAA